MIKHAILTVLVSTLLLGIMSQNTMETFAQVTTIMNPSENNNQWNGSIITFPIITEALLKHVNITITEAIDNATQKVGPDSKATDANLLTELGYLVYNVAVVDKNYNLYDVLIDPSNGNVLDTNERPLTLYNQSSAQSGTIAFDEPLEEESTTGNSTG